MKNASAERNDHVVVVDVMSADERGFKLSSQHYFTKKEMRAVNRIVSLSPLVWFLYHLQRPVVAVMVILLMGHHPETATTAFHQHQPIAKTSIYNRNLNHNHHTPSLSSHHVDTPTPSTSLFRLGGLSPSSSSLYYPVAANSNSRTFSSTKTSQVTESPVSSCTNLRRRILVRLSSSLIAATPLSSLFHPLPSNAATTSSSTDKTKTNVATNKPPPILPLLTTAARLHVIPTYAIVDGNGTPFHTYDKDSASGIGYFFLSYKGAEYVLEDAKKAFEKAKDVAAKARKEEAPFTTTTIVSGENGNADGTNDDDDDDVPESWGRAQIVSIPLDYALQLSIKSTKSLALNGRGKTFATYYQIIPDTAALNAALRIDDGMRYRERGRVPLFFVDGMTVPSNEKGVVGEGGSGSGGGTGSELLHPVYLNIKDLKEEWNKQHPNGEELPPIKVRELNETFRSMIRPGGKDGSVRDIVFVPDSESGGMARKEKVGRSYKLGEMILTK